MNFKELLIKYDKIVIPCLQRDYAQGRTDDKATEIREGLLHDIFSNEGISLNVVFGETSCETFLPIDGQQRLTTLFLLYLYNQKFNNVVTDGLNKFSYETRHSTIDFLHKLVDSDWDIMSIKTSLSEQPISDYIKDQSWYVWPWMYDPTVSGMLVMLDEIHKNANIFEFPNLDEITFDFLDMGKLGLNETLYLKMNSRGHHLNSFEKIKSGLDGLVELIDIAPGAALFNSKSDAITSKLNTFADLWRWEMDRSWSNYFWNPNTCTQDDQFLNFIKAYSIAFHISNISLPQNDRHEYVRDSKLNKLYDNEISWASLKNILEREIGRKTILDIDLTKCYFIGLAKLLNRLGENAKFDTAWGTSVSMKEKDIDNKKIAFIWALVQYSGTSFIGESFKQWLRFVFNMIHNTIDDFNTLVRFIKRVSENYASHSENILEWLSDEDSNQIEDKSEQWAEERCKAKSLHSKDNHSEIILKAEAHPLFEGRIRPLLYNWSSQNLTTDSIEDKWCFFFRRFNDVGAMDATALETFKTLFSFCDISDQLWWDKYVFQNTKDVWKNYIFKLKSFNDPVAHLLNGDEPNQLNDGSPISVLSQQEVLKKVLYIKTDWYIRHPDISLRPYGNMWDGIRLDQSKVLPSVKNLLSVEGLTFANSDNSDFYKNSGLVWGIRISFLYKNKELQLWDDCKLWMGNEYLKDNNGIELRMYDIGLSNLKELIDTVLMKNT